MPHYAFCGAAVHCIEKAVASRRHSDQVSLVLLRCLQDYADHVAGPLCHVGVDHPRSAVALNTTANWARLHVTTHDPVGAEDLVEQKTCWSRRDEDRPEAPVIA
jgi:hypothetical protein